jgi:hypothetical protein
MLTEQEELELLELEEEEEAIAQQNNQQPENRVGGIMGFGSVPESNYQQGERNLVGNIFERPAAAIRSGLQGKGYAEGAVNPTGVPTFQQLALEKFAPKTSSVVANFMGGLIPSTLGLVADIATNPADLLTMLVGKAPVGGGKNLGQVVSATKPMQELGKFLTKERVAPDVAGKIKNVFRYDNALKQAEKAKESLDTIRKTLGKAKRIAIEPISDVPAEINLKKNTPTRVLNQLQKPEYEIELLPDGSIKPTLGNLDKAKEAVSDLLTPKLYEEAGKKEIGVIRQIEGEISSVMRDAARKAGKPIDTVLDEYGSFMDKYRIINHKLTDSAGNAYGNKLKSTFKLGAERLYVNKWAEVAKQSPEIKAIMNSMQKREVLKNVLKYGGGTIGVGILGKGAVDLVTGK